MDELREIELFGDVRASLFAACKAAGEIVWLHKRAKYDKAAANPTGPGWEPYDVEDGYIYFRKPTLPDA